LQWIGSVIERNDCCRLAWPEDVRSVIIHAVGVDRSDRHVREALRDELWARLERQDSAEKSARRAADRLAEIAVAEQSSQRAASEASQCAAEYPAKETLWRQLRSGIELWTSLERQEASELAGDIADGLTEALIAERSADNTTERRSDLTEQIAEEALWCELRTRVEWQKALSKLTRDAADLLAEALVAKRVADETTERRTDLTEQVAEEALRRELRTGIERQEASELAGDIADGLTEALIAECPADDTAERRADLAEQVAEEALWCELRTRIEWQEALSKLTRDAADLLPEALVAKRVADETTERRTDLTEQVAEEALRRELRTGIERQEALSKLTRDAADLLAKALIAERSADNTTKRRADLAEQVAKEALWCELRTGVEWQEALSKLTRDAADLLAQALVTKRVADETTERRADLAEQVAEEALWCELRTGVERQEALSKLTRDAADLLAEALVAKRIADETTERSTDLTEQVAEEALRRKLRVRLEGQEASELAGDAADLLAEPLIAERTADHAAKRRADLAKQIAKEALGGELLSGEQAVRRRCLQCSVHHRIHLTSSSVAVKHAAVCDPPGDERD
jgi:uncharacterized protein YbjQ (UPF0145 family)